MNWGELAIRLLGQLPVLLESAKALRQRSIESGEWTPEQETEYRARSEAIYAIFENKPPPPAPPE